MSGNTGVTAGNSHAADEAQLFVTEPWIIYDGGDRDNWISGHFGRDLNNAGWLDTAPGVTVGGCNLDDLRDSDTWIVLPSGSYHVT